MRAASPGVSPPLALASYQLVRCDSRGTCLVALVRPRKPQVDGRMHTWKGGAALHPPSQAGADPFMFCSLPPNHWIDARMQGVQNLRSVSHADQAAIRARMCTRS